MKKKFELKTSKVKGISFHKSRHNWIGIGLFTGEIQIWDFRNGFKVAEFKESDSCIRTIDFHPIQSIIIGGGDDHTIRGYDYSQNKKVFELKNHVDFIRTVQFHPELPWILSASDDQTIRIWNWQSKNQLAVITGHGHYIMCAKFHPTKDLIVSGSLDSTLRIWDFSKLKSKFSKSHGTLYMFSNDVEPIIITEAHMKGINWVDFHPTERLVATCSDDKLIKLWDYTGSNAYEKQVLHGHTNNVSCLAFSNCGKYLLSNGEDFQLRIWDLSNGTTLDKIETGEERQWVLAVHSKLPLVAVGCDESLNIVSLFPEKILYEKKNNFLIYYSNINNSIQLCDIITNTNKVFNFDKNDDEKRFCKYLTVNNFGKNTAHIDGFYKLKDNLKFFSIRLKDLTSYSKTLQAKEAVFISTGEFVTLESGNINLYQINKFALQESLDIEESIEQIFPALFNHILYRTKKSLVLYNIKEKREIFSLKDNEFGNIKKLIWNPKKTYFAVLNKKGIWIINKHGKIQVQKKIDSKVKSMIWEKNDKIIFNTHEHIDYLLINGESGIIRSIDKIIFLIKIQNKQIIFFDVNEDFEELDIDLSEIEFKTALMNRDLVTVKKMLKETEFLGKSIVSYLLKKKYDSITLQLTNDKETSFYLALHAGKLETAFNIARELESKEKYRILADKATNSGALGLAELCLNLSDQKDKLITHFVVTGNKKELNNLEFSDVTLKFNKTLFTGDIRERIKILAETGQVALAYATAKIHGIKEYEEALLNVIPDLDGKINLKSNSELLLPPKPLVEDINLSKKIMESWPLFDVDEEIQNEKLEELSEDEEIEDETVNNINEKLYKKIINKMKAKKKSFTVLEKTEEINNINDDEETGNWGDDIDDLDISDDSLDNEFKEQVMREVIAWKHFMIGDKKGGKNLLESQIGYIDNPSQLDQMISTLESEYEQKQSLKNPFDMTYIKTRYKLLLSLATKGKLKECLDQVKNLLISTAVSNLKNKDEIEFVEEVKSKLLNYYIAFRAKMLNDKQKDLDKKTELCLIIALTTLEPSHSILILSIVINNLFKLKCYEYTSWVVRKYLKIVEENNLKPDGLKKMMKVLKVCEKRGSNKISIQNISENDLYKENSINRINFEDISLCNVKDLIKCNFDNSRYSSERKDDACILCDICTIGFKGDGLKYI